MMTGFEANLAVAKLEAAGIPAVLANENIAVAHPLLFGGQVRLQVNESDLERAAAVLDAKPADSVADGEYAEEEYRCPACHRKDVDLLPLSGRQRQTRVGCFGVLLAPLIVMGLASVMGVRDGAISYPPVVIFGWVATLAVLAYLVITARRHKRCRGCGHEW